MLDVVGLTPRAARAHAPPAGGRRPGFQATLDTGAARGHLLGAGHVPHRRAAAPGTASSATAGTSATSARCCSGASTTRWSAGRSCGRRPAAPSPATRWPTSAGGTRWARTSTGRSRPRPIYYADGRKEPDCYTDPPELHDELTGAARHVPAVHLLGARRRASPRRRWIAEAAEHILADHATRPDPGLPAAPRLRPAALRARTRRRPPRRPRRWTRCSARCSTPRAARGAHRGGAVRVRHHRRRPAGRRQPGCCAAEGLLRVHTQDGMEYLDPWTSRAFAVADHQVAHVYVARPGRPGRRWRSSAPALPGVAEVLDDDGQGRARPRPSALRRAGAGRRAGRLVHLLLLARRRAGARLRPARRDPPQARLRPGRAVLRPGRRRARPSAGRRRAGPQEARHALPDERGRPGRRRQRGPRLARPAAGRPGRRAGAALLTRPAPRAGTGSPPPR